MAGIGIASGVLGTVGGGAAAVTGFMKYGKDDKISGVSNPNDKLARLRRLVGGSVDELVAAANELRELIVYFNNDNKDRIAKDLAELANIDKVKKESQTLGNVRTIGAGVAGATGAVGAVTSFAGTATLDKLIEDMNACDSYVREIESQKTELAFAAPDDATISQMNKIIESCKGMSSKNIADIKSKLKAAGIISAIGAAAGIAGGITSAMAVSKEKDPNNKEDTKGLNMVANITSGAAAAGNLGGAILSGVTRSGLIKNGDIADKCKAAF